MSDIEKMREKISRLSREQRYMEDDIIDLLEKIKEEEIAEELYKER